MNALTLFQLCGHLLAVAFLFAGWTAVTAYLGGRQNRREWIEACRRGAVVTVLLTLGCTLVLEYALLTSQFQVRYVAAYTNATLPTIYKFTALWAGQAGSLLLWALFLGCYLIVPVLGWRRDHSRLFAYQTMVTALALAFFLFLVAFVENPFTLLDFLPRDGNGLNPQLQNPYMAIHPLMLYLGYVGCTTPFAFAMAALAVGNPGNEWLRLVRRWTLWAWVCLSVGIMLGAHWAYVELGWGGYWAWDPVENASLMPWLAMTAFLHSVMITEKRGVLKIWNIVLVILAFGLSILGTFITRSGVISSVHSFAISGVGPSFLVFLVLSMTAAAALLFYRWPQVRSTVRIEKIISRESSFLFNNVILLGSCLSVLWGTLFPILSEWVTGNKITIGPPYFNIVNVPIYLALFALTAVCPMLAWRQAKWGQLKRMLRWPALVAVLTVAGLLLFRIFDLSILLSMGIAAFVVATIAYEMHRGTRARRRRLGQAYPHALWGLIMLNKRRYGGYIVHLGMVSVLVGVAASSVFQREVQVNLRPQEETRIHRFLIRYEGGLNEETPHKLVAKVRLSVYNDHRPVVTLLPYKEFFKGQEAQATEPAIHSTLRGDLYANLLERLPDGTAVLKLYYNPLVAWIWFGGLGFVLGFVICILPDQRERLS